MAGFASLDDLLNETTVNGKVLYASFAKVGTAPEIQGGWHSLWRVGNYPAAGGDGPAGSGTANTGGTALTLEAGSLAVWANQSPDTKHLLSYDIQASLDCTIMLYDRLVQVSGINLAGTATVNVGSTALPRYSGTASAGVQVWAEVTTVTAGAAPTIAMNSYTDQDGNTGAAGGTVTFPATATNVDSFIGPLPLASGDTGVRSVETVRVLSNCTSGTANIVLLRPIATIPVLLGLSGERSFLSQLPTLPRLYDGHTLALAQFTTATTATNIWGHLTAGYG